MKAMIVILLSILPFSLLAQGKPEGIYCDHFGGRLKLNTDSSFRFDQHVDLASSWTKGRWRRERDTIFFQVIPVYDTFNLGSNSAINDTLVLSSDEKPERIFWGEFMEAQLSGGGQNRMMPPPKLFFKEGRLCRIEDGGLVVEKRRGLPGSQLMDTWFTRFEN